MESAEANACSRRRKRVASGTKIYCHTYLIDFLGIAMEHKEINDELSCSTTYPLRQEECVAIISDEEAFISSTYPDQHFTQSGQRTYRPIV